MKKCNIPVLLFALLSFGGVYAQDRDASPAGVPTDGVHIRDPFVLADPSDGTYYMYGTTRGDGFDVFSSRDLKTWQGPRAIFRRTPDFWGDQCFWAAECHVYKGKYYLFATVRGAADSLLGTAVFVADSPKGPFREHSKGRLTPRTWQALDGTLYVDGKGNPWMVFCHEWTQLGDGTVEAVRLSRDLKKTVGKPATLFRASSAPWVRPHTPGNYVTDGPFLYRNRKGELLMLWSSFGDRGYAIGVARSQSGEVAGPWLQMPEALFARDGGHGMLFRTFDGELLLSIHRPNVPPDERPRFFRVEEKADGSLCLVEKQAE